MILNARGEMPVKLNVPKLDDDLAKDVELSGGQLIIPCWIEQLTRNLKNAEARIAKLEGIIATLEAC